MTGKEAEANLDDVGITVNKNAIPFDPLPPNTASGIRVGTPATTTRGFGPAEMRQIAALIVRAIARPRRRGRPGGAGGRGARDLRSVPRAGPARGVIEADSGALLTIGGAFAAALLISLFLTPLAARFAMATGAIDAPGAARRIHSRAHPAWRWRGGRGQLRHRGRPVLRGGGERRVEVRHGRHHLAGGARPLRRRRRGGGAGVPGRSLPAARPVAAVDAGRPGRRRGGGGRDGRLRLQPGSAAASSRSRRRSPSGSPSSGSPA